MPVCNKAISNVHPAYTSSCLQNKFLRPDPAVVDALVAQLQAKKVGVVAHFYMDPEVQGVLSSAGGHLLLWDGCTCLPACLGLQVMHRHWTTLPLGLAGGALLQPLPLRQHLDDITARSSCLRSRALAPHQHQFAECQIAARACAAERWPHINISDSLVMADGAVKMAEGGCK